MKHILCSIIAAASLTGAAAAETPLWLRDVAISPDGQTIAFTYKGDIYTVPVSGGEARQITTGDSYDASPVWSRDGNRIVFRSDRHGSDDLFIVSRRGGTPTRLTTSSSAERPLAFANDSTLIFAADIMPGRTTAQAPFLGQTWSINVNRPDLRPSLYVSQPMRTASFDKNGRLLYTDRKGYEDDLRKHERSSGTADVWLLDNKKFTKLTDFNGHDRDAVWTGDDTFMFISEEDGTLNVWSRRLDGSDKRQLTRFEKHPVRSLSASANGTAAFSWDGEIYTLAPGAIEPVKVNVEIIADNYDPDLVKRYVTGGASNMAVSPSGDEVAIVLRGDIYVTSTKYKTTKRITDTPAQERCVSFSPDGKTLVYDSDRDGYWQLFTAKAKNPDEKQFAYATDIVETPLYKCETSAQQPEFSPDGKKVAFLEDRTTLRVIDLDTKKVTTALDGKYNYSYTDGDISFSWSPDSKWLLINYIGVGGWNNQDIALVKADGSEVVDLTESGYTDSGAKWVLGGEGLIYASSKYGMKSQASWGNQSDVILMALTPEAWDRFNMTEEEADMADKAKEEADKAKSDDKKGDKKKSKKDKKDKKGKDAKEEKKDIEFDLDNREYRTVRLTGNSTGLVDYVMSPKGDKLYYVAPSAEGKYNLYVRNLRDDATSVLAPGVSGGMLTDAKGENLFVFSGYGIQKINADSGKADAVEFEALYDRRPSLEREYIYDHMLRQVNDKFYDKNLHGVDWKYYGDHYRRFLPYINNNRDFAALLSEILGELNASHTGGRSGAPGVRMSTASLGAYFDEAYDGDGLKVTEVIARGPLSTKEAGIKAGDVITAIDGNAIAPHADYNALLEGKSGKKTRLSVTKADGSKKEVYVRPISEYGLSNLLYRRWVERNEKMVDSLSGGRIAYVHIEGMDNPSFRTVYDKLLGKYRNREAVVVDTRYNGGGWLHNDVALLLSGKEYVRFTPRGRYIGSEPFSQWTKPSAMLVNESNYSDAHGTPFVYQTLGIGDIVGAPVPGTMTAVWWETQIDPSIIFGIPQVTSQNMKGEVLENKQLNPDIVVYNAPADILAGHDAQIEAAVKSLMKKITK